MGYRNIQKVGDVVRLWQDTHALPDRAGKWAGDEEVHGVFEKHSIARAYVRGDDLLVSKVGPGVETVLKEETSKKN